MARAAGSLTTPLFYTFRAGIVEVDVTRMFLSMYKSTASTADDGKFGTLTALTNGLVFRIYNGIHKTAFNFKRNLDIKQMCYDLAYGGASQNSATGVIARISFGSQTWQHYSQMELTYQQSISSVWHVNTAWCRKKVRLHKKLSQGLRIR
jgi:hypothetical protein